MPLVPLIPLSEAQELLLRLFRLLPIATFQIPYRILFLSLRPPRSRTVLAILDQRPIRSVDTGPHAQ